MLLNKSLSNGDVVSIKLTNGDELIARFESESQDDITIFKPLAITIGAQGLGMMPWLFLGDKDMIILKKLHVFVMVPSKKDASDQYIQSTTGIALR